MKFVLSFQDLNRKSFMAYAFVFNYTCPVVAIAVFYTQIVKAVVAHEAALRAQAKKMNVDSLRSNAKEGEDSAEVRIAKVAITNVMLWLCTWTPYAVVCFIGCFGKQSLVTPLVSQLPSFLGDIFYTNFTILSLEFCSSIFCLAKIN